MKTITPPRESEFAHEHTCLTCLATLLVEKEDLLKTIESRIYARCPHCKTYVYFKKDLILENLTAHEVNELPYSY